MTHCKDGGCHGRPATLFKRGFGDEDVVILEKVHGEENGEENMFRFTILFPNVEDSNGNVVMYQGYIYREPRIHPLHLPHKEEDAILTFENTKYQLYLDDDTNGAP